MTSDYNVSRAFGFVLGLDLRLGLRVWVRNGVRLQFGDAVKFGIVAQCQNFTWDDF